MGNTDVAFIVSLVTGVSSVILAAFAIWFAKSAERESRANFDKTRDVLAEIDKRAAVTEKTVSDSHQQLLTTVTNLLNQTVVPAKTDLGEQFGVEFIKTMSQDPEQASRMLQALQPLIEMGESPQKAQGHPDAKIHDQHPMLRRQP